MRLQNLQNNAGRPNIDFEYALITIVVLFVLFIIFQIFFLCRFGIRILDLGVTTGALASSNSRRIVVVSTCVASTAIGICTEAVDLLFFRSEGDGWSLTFARSQTLIRSSANFADVMRTIQRWLDGRATNSLRRLESLTIREIRFRIWSENRIIVSLTGEPTPGKKDLNIPSSSLLMF